MSSKHRNCITIGSSKELKIDPNSCMQEIRTDITVCQYTGIRLWGQIVDEYNCAVPNILVKLVKLIDDNGKKDYKRIAHTSTDCDGFYQFEIYSNEMAWYKILVGKPPTSNSIIV